MSLVQSDKQLFEIVKKVEDFSPKWMYVQPSVLERILECDKFFSFPKLQYIETVGEPLSAVLKRRAEMHFNVQVANLYGSEEMNGIAYESPAGFLELINDNVYVEVKKDNKIGVKGTGEIIITSLINHAMPLIRYQQNDFVSINNSNSIDSIKGRVLDTISINGYELNSFMLMEIISETNNIFNDPISEYAYFYNSKKGVLTCYITLKPYFSMWEKVVSEYLVELFKNKTEQSAGIQFNVTTKKDFSFSIGKHVVSIYSDV